MQVAVSLIEIIHSKIIKEKSDFQNEQLK